jgi:hypothetical protein
MTRSDASVTTLPQPRWRRILLHPGSLLAIGFIWLALAEVVPMFLSEKLLGRDADHHIHAPVQILWRCG